MIETVLSYLIERGGQNTIVIITLLCVLYMSRRISADHKTIGKIARANMVQMRRELHDIHLRSQKERKVNDVDYKNWNETYSIYRDLGGNGVAVGWSKDIDKWRANS